MGSYQLRFSDDLGLTTNAGSADAEAVLLVVGSENDPLASFRPVSIGLGDIDGDGVGDYVAAVNDNLAAGTSTLLILPGIADFTELTLGSDSGRRFPLYRRHC